MTASQRSLARRVKVVLLSLVGLLFPSACAPVANCYVQVAPTATPTPTVTCYTAPPPTGTSPLPTPPTSPLSPLPTPTEEARRSLRDKLLAEGRLPAHVARELGG